MPDLQPPRPAGPRRFAARVAAYNSPRRLAPAVLYHAAVDTLFDRPLPPLPLPGQRGGPGPADTPTLLGGPGSGPPSPDGGRPTNGAPPDLRSVVWIRWAAVTVVGMAAAVVGLGPLQGRASTLLTQSTVRGGAHILAQSTSAASPTVRLPPTEAPRRPRPTPSGGASARPVPLLPDLPPGLPVGAPVSGPVTSEYGPRVHPVSKGYRVHTGTDFAVPLWTPVRATADGVVSSSSRRGGYGLVVELRHRDPSGLSTSTLYAHLSSSAVPAGARVRRGQVVGWSGGTGPRDGVSTGPHVHYEVRVGSSPVDPSSVYDRVRAWRAEAARRLALARATHLAARPPEIR